jgi:hypothetical protein
MNGGCHFDFPHQRTAQPAAIGTMPASSATASALRVTFSSVWLPATVVMANSSMAGLPCASSMAMASS